MSTKRHKVVAGEGISKIAKTYGFRNWETIWDDAANEALKKERHNPHVLHPGDVIYIPAIKTKQESAQTEQKHRFVCKLPKLQESIRVKLEDRDGSMFANKPYVLTLPDGTELRNNTNGDGVLEEQIPLNISSAQLEIEGNIWDLNINELNPVDEPTRDKHVSGAQARLNNLGYPCPETGIFDEKTKQAVKAFQASQDSLRETGELDDDTCSKLRECHGS